MYVQGVSASSDPPDVALTLSYTKDGTTATDTVKFTVVGVDLEIHRADSDPGGTPYGALVPESDEETVGSFTVANLNDTDGDGAPDVGDDSVVATASGQNELDLMRLILEKPKADLGGEVQLTIVSGDVEIWSSSTKGTRITALTRPLTDFSADNDGDGNPDLEWWVEARSPSSSLRSIHITYTYHPDIPGGLTCQDAVKATAVWANVTDVVSQNLTPAEVDSRLGSDWVNADDPPRQLVYVRGGTGVGPPNAPDHNVIVIEFQVTPADMASVPAGHRPRFDITRQISGCSFAWDLDEWDPSFALPDPHPQRQLHYPSQNEEGSDDALGNGDESDEPTGEGHMWVIDGPGGQLRALIVDRWNMREFMRVRFDGTDPSGNEVNGSRCSPKQSWYHRLSFGLVDTPRAIGAGEMSFVREALNTTATTPTNPGVLHHAPMRGLSVAEHAGSVGEDVTTILVEADAASDDTLHTVTEPVFGKLATTLAGDHVAYTNVGRYASRFNGDIVGPAGSGGEPSAELAHEVTPTSANSPSTDVVGTAFTLPAPGVPAMTLGAITSVTIQGARTEADSNAGGTQQVAVHVMDDDGASDDVLDELSATVPRLMVDQGGGDVPAIRYGLVKTFDVPGGRLAGKANGTVIGPVGSSGEQEAEVAYEVELPGANEQSPSTTATGPAYTLTAPTIGTNPIPKDEQSSVTIPGVYVHATGASPGNESFYVELRDADTLLSDLLHRIATVLTRPSGTFAGALIGPVVPSAGTLTNPDPGGVVQGPDGSSGEAEAEVHYRIKDAEGDLDSPTVSVTAED